MDLEPAISAVREALFIDARVSAAILFGSAAKGSARASSDLDIALIAQSPEAAAALAAEHLSIVGKLSLAARRDVQVVLLDGVEPILGRQVFLGSRVLFDRDPARSADVLERILIRYFDGEYHRRMRAEALEHHASRLRAKLPLQASRLDADESLRNDVCFDVLQAVQACIDLAVHACTHEALGVPEGHGPR